MILVAGAFVIIGLLGLGLGVVFLGSGLREARALRKHTGKIPVTPLAHTRKGEVVCVTGVVTSADSVPSPTGRPPAAYLEAELAQIGSFGGTLRSFLSEKTGAEVWMSDDSADGLIRMDHVDLRDRKPVRYVWHPRRRAPDDVLRMLAARGREVPRVPQMARDVPDLAYEERALGHGDPVRVHAVVLDVAAAEPGGRPRVLLGTDGRTWLRVSNTTEAELAQMKQRATRMVVAGGAGALLGLAVVVVSIVVGNLIA